MLACRDTVVRMWWVGLDLIDICGLSECLAGMSGGKIMGFSDPETTNERELGLLMAGVGGKA